MKELKKKKSPRFPDFHLVPHSSGIILDSIWVKNDNSEMIVVSAFGGQWHFRPLKENEIDCSNPPPLATKELLT